MRPVILATALMMITARPLLADDAAEPLRLPSGEPLICAYFFGHWWEPWKSDDDAIRRDLTRLKEIGINAICLDHEPQQWFDREWHYIDREHRLAKEVGVGIIPWLEAKCGADMGRHYQNFKKYYGIDVPRAMDQDGNPKNALIWHPGYRDALTAHTLRYLDRYGEDGAILRVRKQGQVRRAISLVVETGWDDVSFDDETNARFREWLRGRYATIADLNEAWDASYDSFDAVDPRDKDIFAYEQVYRDSKRDAVPKAVADHTQFRAELIDQALREVKRRVSARHPDLLFLAEIPYTWHHDHPHAVAHTYRSAMLPVAVSYADIIMFRTVDNRLGEADQAECRRLLAEGKDIILSHRTYQPKNFSYPDAAQIIAGQAASLANGLGYYSWNEMVDTHIVQRDDTEEFISLVESINTEYRRLTEQAGP
jgi:hypothetical protein